MGSEMLGVASFLKVVNPFRRKAVQPSKTAVLMVLKDEISACSLWAVFGTRQFLQHWQPFFEQIGKACKAAIC